MHIKIDKIIKLQILSIIGFLFLLTTLAVNFMASFLPLNGVTTGQISDRYFNLITPVGVTFSVWGVIYFLLILFSLYSLFGVEKKVVETDFRFLKKLQILFIATCIFNSLWIFAWHYFLIEISVLIMILLLFSLIQINILIKNTKSSYKRSFIIKTAFAVYFSWITIATVLNITALFVSLNLKISFLSVSSIASLMLIISALISAFSAIYISSVSHLLVSMWAFYGIFLKHSSVLYFNYKYQDIIISLYICFTVFIFSVIYISSMKKLQNSSYV